MDTTKTYKYVLGIDLGTTNTVACYLNKGKPDLVRFKGTDRMLPSVIYVEANGSITVGEKAKNKGVIDRPNMIRSSKTWIGDVEANKTWTCRGRVLNPTDVAEHILREVRRQYVEQVDCDPDETIGAVITVPAYFRGSQFDATKEAAMKAGFEVLAIISEPMAAAIAAVQGLDLQNKNVFVVDIGGGTFDLSVLHADNANHKFAVLAKDGDNHLGGDDFDLAVARHLRKVIEDDTSKDLSSAAASGMVDSDYAIFMDDLVTDSERAKIELSQSSEADINRAELKGLPGAYLETVLGEDDFNEICQPLYDRIMERTSNFLLNNSAFKKEDIGELILAGGSCSIPYIQREIKKLTGLHPRSEMNRSYLVAFGAAYVADSLNGMSVEARNSYNEILAYSLGVEIQRGDKAVFCRLLNKGEQYPCATTRDGFTTMDDNQEQVYVNVYEAGLDKEDVEDIGAHKLYGTLVLEGIERARAGEPNIEISFNYDRDGCLKVSARDTRTGANTSLEFKKGAAAASAKPKTPPMDIMLLMDASGSMGDYDRMTHAVDASTSLIKDMIDFSIHRMGLISFADNPHMHNELTRDKDALLGALNKMQPFGGTEMSRALTLAQEKMANCEAVKVIILVTDGEDFHTGETLAIGRQMKDKGYRIFTIGAGDKIDKKFLADLASPGDFYQISSMNELKKTFEKVMSGLTQKR